MNGHYITQCVACDSNDLELVVDLGNQPHANSYRKIGDNTQLTEYPLAINRCKYCNHVQLTYAVDPDEMFRDYLYVSGTSKTGHEHFKKFAHDVDEFMLSYLVDSFIDANWQMTKRVIDIGANDGTQLNYFKKLGYVTYAVEPAGNLRPDLVKGGHKIYEDYFTRSIVPYIKDDHISLITAQNVFAHTVNPLEMLLTAKELFDNNECGGMMFIQTSQADMILNNEFDTIYHEHISFFCIQSMYRLCKRAGLVLYDVDRASIHGGSFIFMVAHPKTLQYLPDVNERLGIDWIHTLMMREEQKGLYDNDTYKKYAENVTKIKNDLTVQLDGYGRNDVGMTIVGYGAAAKGMTVLNYIGDAAKHISFIIDDNPLKQNRLTPGSSIPILSSDELKKYENSDSMVFIPLAWNFFEEIKERIQSIRGSNKHDIYIKYFPNVTIIDDNKSTFKSIKLNTVIVKDKEDFNRVIREQFNTLEGNKNE